MSLKTDSFPVKKHWLSAGLKTVPFIPKIFSKAALSDARKTFLAGDNQLTAIRAWMEGAELITKDGWDYKLAPFGATVAAKDPELDTALSWWLIHIHLSANDNFPYSTLFCSFDVDGNWMVVSEILKELGELAERQEMELSIGTIESYFAGVDASLRPGQMLYMLGLIERREVKSDGKVKQMIRRTSVRPGKELIVYAALLLHRRFFKGQETVQTSDLLNCGFARILGMRDSDLREQLSEMRHDKECASLIEYTRRQDIDSIYFKKQGSAPLSDLRDYCYNSGAVKWK